MAQRVLPTINSPSLGVLQSTGSADARGNPIYKDSRGDLITQQGGNSVLSRPAPSTMPATPAAPAAPATNANGGPVIQAGADDPNATPIKKFSLGLMQVLGQYQKLQPNIAAAGVTGNRLLDNAQNAATLAPLPADLAKYSPATQGSYIAGQVNQPATVLGEYNKGLDIANAQADTLAKTIPVAEDLVKTNYPFEVNRPPSDVVDNYNKQLASGQIGIDQVPVAIQPYVQTPGNAPLNATQLANKKTGQEINGNAPLQPGDIANIAIQARKDALASGLTTPEEINTYVKAAVDQARQGTQPSGGNAPSGGTSGSVPNNNYFGISQDLAKQLGFNTTPGTAANNGGPIMAAFKNSHDSIVAAATILNSPGYSNLTPQAAISKWKGGENITSVPGTDPNKTIAQQPTNINAMVDFLGSTEQGAEWGAYKNSQNQGAQQPAAKASSQYGFSNPDWDKLVYTTDDGRSYIKSDEASKVAGSQGIVQQALKSGIKVLDASQVDNVQKLDLTTKNLKALKSITDKFSNGPLGVIAGVTTRPLGAATQSNQDLIKLGEYRLAAINALQGLGGGAGANFRITGPEIQNAIDSLPTIQDTKDSANTKITAIQSFVNDKLNQVLPGKTPPNNSQDTNSPVSVIAPDGKTYHFPNQAAANTFKKQAGI